MTKMTLKKFSSKINLEQKYATKIAEITPFARNKGKFNRMSPWYIPVFPCANCVKKFAD